MKIALPVDDKSLDSNVCRSFGRAPYFLVFSTEKNTSEFLDNNAAVAQGGAGIRASQTIADLGIKALLAPRCGENARRVLFGAQVLVYQSIPGTARENIDAFLSSRLALLETFHPGFHGAGEAE
jgi:predicted Fe-Mo cluster-binding NifX family protein